MRFVHTQPERATALPRSCGRRLRRPGRAVGPGAGAADAQGLRWARPLRRSGWQPLSDKNALYGDWMAEGGGHVLELAPGGSYYVADESGEVVDRGQWSQRGSDLTLTSSAASAECSEGDRLVLGGVEQVTGGTTVMRGTVRTEHLRRSLDAERVDPDPPRGQLTRVRVHRPPRPSLRRPCGPGNLDLASDLPV